MERNEWDCLQRSRNEYAWDENGRLCTNDEKTANLFRLLDMQIGILIGLLILLMLVIKVALEQYEVNLAVGGEPNSYHTRGCAADIHISGQDDTDTALADTVVAAAKAWGIEDQLGIGYYGDWIHVDTRGYPSRW